MGCANHWLDSVPCLKPQTDMMLAHCTSVPQPLLTHQDCDWCTCALHDAFSLISSLAGLMLRQPSLLGCGAGHMDCRLSHTCLATVWSIDVLQCACRWICNDIQKLYYVSMLTIETDVTDTMPSVRHSICWYVVHSHALQCLFAHGSRTLCWWDTCCCNSLHRHKQALPFAVTSEPHETYILRVKKSTKTGHCSLVCPSRLTYT